MCSLLPNSAVASARAVPAAFAVQSSGVASAASAMSALGLVGVVGGTSGVGASSAQTQHRQAA
eukprot:12338971-Heterocapsa_arctica.AAC.1